MADEYTQALDYLRLLAQQELARWWARQGEDVITSDELRKDIAGLADRYGEQAGYAAVEYLVLSRSFGDELKGLGFPDRAPPDKEVERRRTHLRAILLYHSKADPVLRAQAKTALDSVVARLVALPTDEEATLGGRAFARIPAPGACGFCFMLASRGAVYTREAVGRANKHHPGCQCLGIECQRDESDLPRINCDLRKRYQVLSRELGYPPNAAAWEHYRRASKQQAEGQEWPLTLYAKVPKYTKGGFSQVFKGERIPPLDKMPGHVLNGWKDQPGRNGDGRPHGEGLS